MPHKKNPVMSMELCGLARVVRGYLATAMESTVIWQEGDTTSLAVERIVMPDVSNVTCYAIGRARSLIESLGVDREAMLAKYEDSLGLPFSSSLLQVLIDSGLGRDEAYRAVQRAAALARQDRLNLREAFLRSTDGTSYSAEQVEEAFSLERALRNVPVIMSALGDDA
jgi:adenylosuccinate lyase